MEKVPSLVFSHDGEWNHLPVQKQKPSECYFLGGKERGFGSRPGSRPSSGTLLAMMGGCWTR